MLMYIRQRQIDRQSDRIARHTVKKRESQRKESTNVSQHKQEDTMNAFCLRYLHLSVGFFLLLRF